MENLRMLSSCHGSNKVINTFFISDTHFGHANIIKYCNRPFLSVKEMDITMIYNWNKVVGKNDIVCFLGDFCFGDPKKYLKQLNGIIVFIKGNHDRNLIETLGERVLPYTYYHRYHLGRNHRFYLIHDPEHIPSLWYDWAITGHVHNKGDFINFRDRIINVSVEHIEYTPINIKLIIDMISCTL